MLSLAGIAELLSILVTLSRAYAGVYSSSVVIMVMFNVVDVEC